MATTRTIKRETVIPAWAGTVDDVERLAHSVLGDAFKDQIDDERAELEQEKAQVESETGFSDAYRQTQVERLNEEFQRRWGLEATATDRHIDQTRSGPLSEVLTEVSATDVESISLTIPRFRIGSDASRVYLRWGHRGLAGGVEGDTETWVAAASASIMSEATRCRPPWAWIKSKSGGTALFLGAYLVLSAIAVVFVIPHVAAPWQQTAAILTVLIAAAVAYQLTVGRFSERFLPPFQFLGPNEKSTGTGFLVGIGIFILTTAVSITIDRLV